MKEGRPPKNLFEFVESLALHFPSGWLAGLARLDLAAQALLVRSPPENLTQEQRAELGETILKCIESFIKNERFDEAEEFLAFLRENEPGRWLEGIKQLDPQRRWRNARLPPANLLPVQEEALRKIFGDCIGPLNDNGRADEAALCYARAKHDLNKYIALLEATGRGAESEEFLTHLKEKAPAAYVSTLILLGKEKEGQEFCEQSEEFFTIFIRTYLEPGLEKMRKDNKFDNGKA